MRVDCVTYVKNDFQEWLGQVLIMFLLFYYKKVVSSQEPITDQELLIKPSSGTVRFGSAMYLNLRGRHFSMAFLVLRKLS